MLRSDTFRDHNQSYSSLFVCSLLHNLKNNIAPRLRFHSSGAIQEGIVEPQNFVALQGMLSKGGQVPANAFDSH